LEELAHKCERHRDRLEIRCQDINDALRDSTEQFDIISLNSFLHHIPDYLSLIEKCAAKLSPHGIFFSFQDPLRYDTVSLTSRTFTDFGYFLWRLAGGARGDVIGGIGRRLRRRRGVYLDDCFQDNAEYHMVRNGVDQLAIEKLLRERGFECNLVTYYSTQNSMFQPIGAALGFKNTFAMIATRGSIASDSPLSDIPRKSYQQPSKLVP
jgi:SAM-dependent methyltransferase